MAKKVYTPEEYKAKLDKKVEKRTKFTKVFLTTLAFSLAAVMVFSATVIANKPVASGGVAAGSSSKPSEVFEKVDNVDAKATVATDPVDVKKELSNSSPVEEVVEYFNSAINLVKPNAKKITLVKETNSQQGSISGNLPGTLTGLADSLISSNMGDKDLSKLDPGLVNATTLEQKNAMFPVENETWSSKLAAEDVASFDVQDDGSNYVIKLNIKPDDLSTATDHGVGHSGRIFSVIKPSIVTDNAGKAAGIIKDVKTGHKDGYVQVTVDKATGNVTAATYYFTWTLSLKAMGIEVSIPFGLQKDFTIAW